MKKHLRLTVLLAFLVPSLLSCQDDDDISSDFLKDSIESFEDSDGFVIKDGMIAQPEWLASAVDSVALSHKPNEFGHYTYPMVFKVSHEGKDYYLVDDPWKSTMDYVVLTLKGERISVDEAWSIINEKNRVVLWLEPSEEMPPTEQ